MIFRLLKNDFLRGKLTNLVMMVFITISALLSCTSVSLIYNAIFQIDYFMEDMGNTAALNFSMMNVSDQDKQNIVGFLDEKGIQDYEIESNINIPIKDIEIDSRTDISCVGCFIATQPKKYNLIYDEDNQVPDIEKGYIGLPLSMKDLYDVSIGDLFTISRGDQVFTYKIQSFIRDSLYGSDMMGKKRILFHPDDYEQQYMASDASQHAISLSIDTSEDQEKLEYDMQQAGLPNYVVITKDTAHLSFLGMTIGFSAIMMLCGVILLGMSFLIIRYTILFQIENSYSEIGIMKAIGFQHKQIKPLYMMKYIGIGFVSTLIGFGISIPFVSYLKEMQAGVVPLMPGAGGTYLSFMIVPIILCMMYMTTTFVLRKIRKQSVMDAIRKGNEGESYHKVSCIELSKKKRMKLTTFLATNDLLAHFRNSIMIIFIYAFCILLILVPLTLKDAFEGDAFLQLLKITSGDIYTNQDSGKSMEEVKSEQIQLQKDLQAYDADVEVRYETMTGASISEGGLNTSGFLMQRADDNAGILFDEGSVPLLADEVALSSTLAKRYDKTIGDTIIVSYDNQEATFFITGIYTSMMNLGNNILAGKDMAYDFAYSNYMVVNFSLPQAEKQAIIEQILNENKWSLIDKNEMMKSFSGDMATQVGSLSNLITIILLIIVLALTFLFSKLQMIKERKAIALMQSLGYSRKHIRKWQMQRCMIQAILGTAIGMLLHYAFTSPVLSWFFEVMGMGKIGIEYDPIHAFVIYPIIFIICIWIAQLLVNKTIQKWNVKALSEE